MKSLSDVVSSHINEGKWSSMYDDNSPEGQLAKYVYAAEYAYLDTDVLNQLMLQYSNTKKHLAYRGLFFNDKDSYLEFMSKIQNGSISLRGYTSWTRSISTAEQFALTKPTNNILLLGREFFKAEDERHKVKDYTQGYGIILQTIIRPGTAIDVSTVPHVGQEDELILTSSNVKCKVVKIFKPHRDSVQDIQDLNKWILTQRSLKGTEKLQYSMLEHILTNYEETLNEKSRRFLFMMFSGTIDKMQPVFREDSTWHYDKILKPGTDSSKFSHGKWDDDALINNREQSTYSIYISRLNYNMLMYYDIFVDEHKRKIDVAMERLGRKLIDDIHTHRNDETTDVFYKLYNAEAIYKHMSTETSGAIKRLLTQTVATYYQKLNSKETVDSINKLSGSAQRQAIDNLVDSYKKLFKNM